MKGIRAILNNHAHSNKASLAPPLEADHMPFRSELSVSLLAKPRIWSVSLPALRMRHEIYMAAGCPPEQTHWRLFCQQEEDAPARYLEQLTGYTKVIALPEWADQVWAIALEREWVTPMTGHGILAWHCRGQASAMQGIISDLLAQGQLPVPEPEHRHGKAPS